jgi:hypothetical protein
MENSAHVQVENLKYLIDKLAKTKTYKVICHTGTGSIYQRILSSSVGLDTMNVQGDT